MRELTDSEIEEVAGGDGMRLPGGGYISNVAGPTKFLGVVGAFTTSYSVGHSIGSAIDSRFGFSSSIGGWAHDRAEHGINAS